MWRIVCLLNRTTRLSITGHSSGRERSTSGAKAEEPETSFGEKMVQTFFLASGFWRVKIKQDRNGVKFLRCPSVKR